MTIKQTIKSKNISKEIIDKLILSLKNYELYPEHHIIIQTSVNDCMDQLASYIETDTSLSLTITKNEILHNGVVVYQGPSGEENPAYQMYRDGIEWLEFHHGITRDEFVTFLKILKKHSTNKNKEEGDIVTELWEADFYNITYKTTDVFWKDEPLIDFSHIRVVDPPRLSDSKPTEEHALAESIADHIVTADIFKLRSDEINQTIQMVYDEEHRNFDVDLFDVLLVILKEQNKEDDFAVVLDIIMESFQHTLERAEFSSLIRFFDKLKKLKTFYEKTQVWAIPYLEDFMLIISSNKVLASLHKAWPNIDINNQVQLDNMQEALTQLSPQAIHSLCPIILQVPSSRIQKQLIESIKGLARKDIRPLIKLLGHPDEKIVQNVVFILGYLPGEEATKALIKKFKTSTDTLRNDVVKSLVKRKPLLTKVLLPLVEDPDPAIRKYVINRLYKERNTVSERYLMHLINNRKFTKGDRNFLIKLYRALGGCGSGDAIRFLQKQLSKRAWFKNTIISIHHEGAALALSLLKLPEAEHVLSRVRKKIKTPDKKNV